MAYYVIGIDGGRYGPADVAQLNQWAQEGRIVPASTLEEESSGMRLVAAQVAGLSFPPGAARSTLTASPYREPYPGYVQPGRDAAAGQTEMILAWILGAIGLCCPVVGIGGVILGSISMNKGNTAGKAAVIFGIVMFLIGIAVRAFVTISHATPHGRLPF